MFHFFNCCHTSNLVKSTTFSRTYPLESCFDSLRSWSVCSVDLGLKCWTTKCQTFDLPTVETILMANQLAAISWNDCRCFCYIIYLSHPQKDGKVNPYLFNGAILFHLLGMSIDMSVFSQAMNLVLFPMLRSFPGRHSCPKSGVFPARQKTSGTSRCWCIVLHLRRQTRAPGVFRHVETMKKQLRKKSQWGYDRDKKGIL